MSQTPAGWFPSEGQERYWDGTQWTQHTRPTGTVIASPQVEQSPQPPDGTTKLDRKPWYFQSWFIGVAAGLVGLIIGVALAGGAAEADPTSSAEYESQAEKLNTSQDDLASTEEKLAAAQGELESIAGDLPDREKAVENAQADLDKREEKLDGRESELNAAEDAVSKREKKVGIVEDRIAANTVAGDGMYKVGTDMAPGTYKTNGRTGCYYAVLNSTDTFDIAVNGNPNGPAFATVSEGQYFEATRCADWVLQ